MTDETRSGQLTGVIERMPKDSVLIFRHYGITDRALAARQVVRACHKRHIRCLIAADALLARRCKADGVHLPEHMLRGAPVRRFAPIGWWVTGAAHCRASVRRAQSRNLTAVLLSPVFASRSHPEGKLLGTLAFATIAHSTRIPLIALGGVHPHHFRRLAAAGACGVAGIDLFSPT